MVFAAKRVTIEQPHATFLARADQKLAVAIIKDHRRGVHVEVAAPQPVGVWGGEIVDQLQLLLCIELHANDAVAKPPVRRIELRVTGAEIDGTVRRNRGATSAPEPSPCGDEGART